MFEEHMAEGKESHREALLIGDSAIGGLLVSSTMGEDPPIITRRTSSTPLGTVQVIIEITTITITLTTTNKASTSPTGGGFLPDLKGGDAPLEVGGISGEDPQGVTRLEGNLLVGNRQIFRTSGSAGGCKPSPTNGRETHGLSRR